MTTAINGRSFKKFNRQRILRLIFVGMLLLACLFSPNLNMMVQVVAIIGVPILLINFLWCLRKSTARRIESSIQLVVWTAVCAATFGIFRYQDYQLESATEPAIAALELYKTKNGRYPEKIDELFLSNRPKPPYCQPFLMYNRIERNGDDSYYLNCVTFGFNKHSYDSKSKSWGNWD